MGVRLIVEILDHWQDAGLTAGERADLLVLAENANDQSRETFGPVHEEYILKRAGKKAAAWRVAIAALKRKGVLEYATQDGRELSGRPGQHAVYRIPVLCPDPPHDGYKGMCTRPERVSSQLTHTESNANRMGEPSANPSTGMGYPTATERVSPDLTPTPPSPSTTSSSTPAPSAGPSRVLEGGGGGSPAGNDKHHEAVAFLRALPAPWTAGKATAERLAPLLLEQTADNGWHLDDQLTAKLTENPGGINNYPAVLRRRLEDLPRRDVPRPRSAGSSSSLPPWCEKCGDGNKSARSEARYRVFIDDNGFAKKCPACHPDALAARAA